MEFQKSCLKFIVFIIVVLGLGGRSEAAISEVLAFGDSILDTGNNNYLLTFSRCNFPPYGMSLPLKLPTGRFGNGKVFSDVLSEKLGLKDMLPAYLSPRLKDSDLATGVCFASGGSGLDDLTANIQGVVPLGRQLNNFKKYMGRLSSVEGDVKAKAIISKALILVSAGNNDLGITYSARLRPLLLSGSYINKLMPLAEDFVKQMYSLGARKIGYMGVLPLGCLPANILFTGPIMCNEFLNGVSRRFNSQLQLSLQSLSKSLPGADIFYIDVYNPLYDVIKNARSLGFTDGRKPCCNGIIPCRNVETHIFWDFAHPTERTYRIMMDKIVPAYASHFR